MTSFKAVSHTHRRMMTILFFLLLALLSAGCASSEAGKTLKSDNAVKPASGQTSESEPPSQRIVQHDAGQTTITGEPQKIAALDYRLADQLLALGIKPYASATYMGSLELPYLDRDALTGVIPLGDTPNLEAVVEAAPDLILSRDAKVYDELSKIAPTAILETPDDWREGFLKMGDILNKQEEARKWLEQYDQQLTEARERIAEHVKPGETFMYLRIQPKVIRVYGPNHGFAEVLFSGLGLTPAPGIETIEKAEQISLESLPDFNPDYLFLEVGNSDEDAAAKADYETYAATSVWKNLDAVKQGRVYSVPHWTISDYPLIKEKSLELIVHELTEGSGASPK